VNSHHSRRTGLRMRAKVTAVVAGSLALALGTSVAASADDGPAATTLSSTAKTPYTTASTSTWSFGIDGRDSSGTMWDYAPAQNGFFEARQWSGEGMGGATAFFKNNSANTAHVNLYARFGSQMLIFDGSNSSGKALSGNWSAYTAFVTPGNIGGAVYPDLLARDKYGVLWEFLSYSNGTFAGRIEVGGGWNTYTQIAGRDDLTGDGKPDIVGRDASGVLWLYRGTGDYKRPFAPRTRIGGGWNTYNRIIGLGDTNADGHNDLIARDKSGYLWFYAGTGSASAPYKPRKQIGHGWNVYNYLF
jgi:hypothetical protein